MWAWNWYAVNEFDGSPVASTLNRRKQLVLNGKQIGCLPPAFNAEKHISVTCRELFYEIVDKGVVADYQSLQASADLARNTGIVYDRHLENRG